MPLRSLLQQNFNHLFPSFIDGYLNSCQQEIIDKSCRERENGKKKNMEKWRKESEDKQMDHTHTERETFFCVKSHCFE
jgi:hypothetical protein